MTRRFFAPTLITSEVGEGMICLYGISDLPEKQDDLLEVRLYDAEGVTEARSVSFTLRNGNQKLMELPCPEDTAHGFLAFRDQKRNKAHFPARVNPSFAIQIFLQLLPCFDQRNGPSFRESNNILLYHTCSSISTSAAR